MLFPAAVVIVLLLGALVVDSAIVYLAQRQAHGAALDAANDAVGAGLDADSFRRGEVRVDPRRVSAVAAESLRAGADDDVHLVGVELSAEGAVTVTVRYRVRRLFGVAFGAADTTGTISATAVGDVGEG